MRSVTEFWSHTLIKGLKAKEALAAEGKTPEEIQQNLGETFKLEGDKLKYFANAIEVASKNLEKLHRVLIVSLAEGENAPQKATKFDELHYVPDFIKEPKPIETQKADGKGGGKGRPNRGGGGGKGAGGPKSSPWGLTPEEKAKKGPGKKA